MITYDRATITGWANADDVWAWLERRGIDRDTFVEITTEDDGLVTTVAVHIDRHARDALFNVADTVNGTHLSGACSDQTTDDELGPDVCTAVASFYPAGSDPFPLAP